MIRRVLRVALLSAIVAVPLWWGYGLLNPQTDRALRAQRPAWTRCPGSLDMECASVKVPLDHHAHDTSSRPEPENIMEQARIARENAPISGSWQIWGSIQCQGWDTVAGSMWWGDPPPQLTPIMIVGTVGDPVVPYQDVKNLRSTLSGSVMVTLQGNSHTAYRAGDRCVNDTVEAFLLDGVVPGADVECPAAGTGER